MRWHKRIRLQEDGVDVAADVDAVIAVNHGRPGSFHRADSVSRVTVVQDSRRASDAGEQPQHDPKERE